MTAIDQATKKKLLVYQKNEITEYHVYLKLAKTVKTEENRKILQSIAEDELRHYREWRNYTQKDVSPDWFQLWKYWLISRVLGLTFGLKLMERGEDGAQTNYAWLKEIIHESEGIIHDESEHENELVSLLDEEFLRYTGSIVLGLNDALVELTGALAGFTLALQNTRLIAVTGLITGIAAALSMGASEYLSTKSEQSPKNAGKASIYTGTTYVITVFALIVPYLILDNFYVCLACTLVIAILIMALFNYYISVAQDLPFRSRFLEMAGLSLGVAALSFFIGFVVRSFLGVDI